MQSTSSVLRTLGALLRGQQSWHTSSAAPSHAAACLHQLQQRPTSPVLRRLFAAEAAGQEASSTLTIDPSAVQRLKKLQSQNPDKDVSLRIEVEGGGCSGFQYKFSLDANPPASTDKVFEQDGTRVVCDPDSFEMLQGSRIEFEDTLIKRSFVVASNPNSEASCGCGSSFTAKLPPISRPTKAQATAAR